MFVSDEWISSISHSIPTLFYPLDIRRMISSQFQLIASQCRSSQVAVTDAVKALASSQLYMPTMLSRDLLNTQMKIIADEMKKNVVAEQRQSRDLIEVVNEQNQLTSGLTNSYLYVNVDYIVQEFYVFKYVCQNLAMIVDLLIHL